MSPGGRLGESGVVVREFPGCMRSDKLKDDDEMELTGRTRLHRRYVHGRYNSVASPSVDCLPAVLLLLPLLPLGGADDGRRLSRWRGREVLTRQWAAKVVLDNVVVLGNVAPVRGRVGDDETICVASI